MAPSRDQLLTILSIARDNTGLRGGRGLSLRQLMEEADYRALRPHIDASHLADVLETEPAIIDEWLAYCEDKRTSYGWGFGRSQDGGWLVDGPDDVRERFDSRSAACAEYVLRELDFWAAVRSAK